jgi:acyl-CoA synthetase (AMP-forming)/AMP-acid ligase II
MTGDIGMIDDRGRLFLRGRERDEINKGGLKIYPADIDEVVGQFEETEDVCTFRLEDEQYGENVGMAVALKNRSAESICELRNWMEAHLAQHKLPVRWYLLNEIPRTSRGKINREMVMQICMSKTPLNLQRILREANAGHP